MLTALAVLALAGCGGGSDSAAAAPTGAAPSTTAPTASTTTQSATAAAASAPLRITGPVSTPVDVGPGPDTPLQFADRDAGISVRLRDGSTLWLFGDTAERTTQSTMRYFVIGTAAWAPPGEPTVTRDYATERAEPVPFAAPGPGSPPCPGNLNSGTWPASAVVQPDGPRDRVIVWLENVCLGTAGDSFGRGMAVAEWIYDPANPPDRQPITARFLNPSLFPGRSYGLASVLGDQGEVYTYTCGAPLKGGAPELYGPCSVAHVTVDAVGDPTAYRVWNGTDWGGPPAGTIASDPAMSNPNAAGFGGGPPMNPAQPTAPGAGVPGSATDATSAMGPAGPVGPGGVQGGPGAGAAPMVMPSGGTTAAPYPAGSFSVVKDPIVGKFVMTYSPWPALSEQIEVRVADQATGPWSQAVDIPLPGCADHRAGDPPDTVLRCYAGNSQPIFSTPGHLGIGWYDRMVSDNPQRGRFRVATVPFDPPR